MSPLPFPIAASQTDCQSPVDDNLMDSIRLDLEYLDTLLSLGTNIFNWNITGRLSRLRTYKGSIDTMVNYKEFLPTKLKVSIRKSGNSGDAIFDILKHTLTSIPITKIDNQMAFATQSIARVGAGDSTTSISNATPQIATQSITFAKAALSVGSIINVGTNLWRYNLTASPDSDWAIGDSVLVSGCISGGNNGTFVILEINQSGFNDIVVSNAAGVAQLTASGSVQLQLMSYNYVNPVISPYFFAASNRSAVFTAHSSGLNNGIKTIYAINQAGNNIWVKNPTGVTQAGIAGAADSDAWSFNFAVAADATAYIVGETAATSGHTNPANNVANIAILLVNDGGNNLILVNNAGVAQGGAAGTVNTLRWIYTSLNPVTGTILVGDMVKMEGHVSANSNGNYEVKQIDSSNSSNRLSCKSHLIINFCDRYTSQRML